jgi:hypothetical protein
VPSTRRIIVRRFEGKETRRMGGCSGNLKKGPVS